MAPNKRSLGLVSLSIVGIAFSGYLTYYTFSTGQSGCEQYYFGFPSCFYGLVIYSLIFVPSVWLFLSDRNKITTALLVLSVIGIGFSRSLTAYIVSLRSCTSLTVFGIPPCVMGLAMYILV